MKNQWQLFQNHLRVFKDCLKRCLWYLRPYRLLIDNKLCPTEAVVGKSWILRKYYVRKLRIWEKSIGSYVKCYLLLRVKSVGDQIVFVEVWDGLNLKSEE